MIAEGKSATEAAEGFRKVLKEHNIAQLRLHGAAAEWGRTGWAFRQKATMPNIDSLGLDLDAMSHAELRDIADEMAGMRMDPNAASKFLEHAPNNMDILAELRMAAMLSAPKGRIRDIISNVNNAGLGRPLVILNRSILETPGTLFGAKRTVTPMDALRTFTHAWGSVPEAARVAVMSWKQGRSALGDVSTLGRKNRIAQNLLPQAHGATKYGGRKRSAIEEIGRGTRAFPEGSKRRAVQIVYGAGARGLKAISLDVIQAFDDFGKVMSAAGSLQFQAAQRARLNPGTFGFAKEMQRLMDTPTMPMIRKMRLDALVDTFQDNNAISKFVTAIRQKGELRLLVPFVRTQAAISKFVVEHDLILGTAYAGYKIAKAKKVTNALVAEHMAKPLMGIYLGAGVLPFVLANRITGSRSTIETQKSKVEGAPPSHSIKIGDTWWDYRRWPMGQSMGMMVDWMTLAKDIATVDREGFGIDERFKFATDSFWYNVAQPGFLRSFQDVFRAFPGGVIESDDFANDFLVSVLPAIVTYVTDVHESLTEDPAYQRQQENLKEKFMYRIPGLRQDLPKKLDAYDEPIEKPYGLGRMIGSGVAAKDPETEAIAVRAQKVNAIGNQLSDLGYRGDTGEAKGSNMFVRHSPEEVIGTTQGMLDQLEKLGVQPPVDRWSKIRLGKLSKAERFPEEDRKRTVTLLDNILKAQYLAYQRAGNDKGMNDTMDMSIRFGFRHVDFWNKKPEEVEERLEKMRP
jgi:hypothetical protein